MFRRIYLQPEYLQLLMVTLRRETQPGNTPVSWVWSPCGTIITITTLLVISESVTHLTTAINHRDPV